MARTKATALSNKSKGAAFESGKGYKGVKRQGSKYGWFYEDGKTRQSKGGFDTAEEAAYSYDEFLIAYVGGNADTNQALGFLKTKTVLAIREKIARSEKPKEPRKGRGVGLTGLKGVHLASNKATPWMAQLAHNGKILTIGKYKTALMAARAYDLAALKYKGVGAETNISLGLVPPFGKEQDFIEPDINSLLKNKKAQAKPRVPKPAANDDHGDDDETQPAVNTGERFIPPSDHDAEREAQIIAARAMQDDDISNAEDCGGTPESESNSEPDRLDSIQVETASTLTPEEPAPTIITTELITMSDADKLRARAEQMLREAAAMEAGNIKKLTFDRLTQLTAKVSAMQETMLKMIDCCAEIELEIHNIKESLK